MSTGKNGYTVYNNSSDDLLTHVNSNAIEFGKQRDSLVCIEKHPNNGKNFTPKHLRFWGVRAKQQKTELWKSIG